MQGVRGCGRKGWRRDLLEENVGNVARLGDDDIVGAAAVDEAEEKNGHACLDDIETLRSTHRKSTAKGLRVAFSSSAVNDCAKDGSSVNSCGATYFRTGPKTKYQSVLCPAETERSAEHCPG